MMSYLDINILCWSNDMCIRLSFHSLRDSHALSFMAMNIGRKRSKQMGSDSLLLGQHNVSYCTGRLVAVIFNYHINDHIVSFFILLLLLGSWMYWHITTNAIKSRWYISPYNHKTLRFYQNQSIPIDRCNETWGRYLIKDDIYHNFSDVVLLNGAI